MFKLESQSWYSEAFLRTYGINAEALAEARERGELPCRDLGKGSRMYRGDELLRWFEGHRQPATPEGASP